jgi:hypothetical protein
MSAIQILISRVFLNLSVMVSLIYIILEIYYYHFISDSFEYMGFIQDFNFFKFLTAKFIFILLLILSYSMFKRSKFLYSIFLVLLLFFYIPNAIFFSFSNGGIPPFISNTFFVSLFLITPFINFKLPVVSLSQNNKDVIMFVLPIVLIIPIVVTFKMNFNLNTLLLSDIYSTRDLFSEKMLGWLAYIYNFEVKTIIPIALIFFMIKKRYLLVGLMSLLLIYLFVISGNKIVYFTPFIIFFFYYLGNSYISKIRNFFIITFALLFITPFVDGLFFNSPVLGGTFINRFFFIPALLTQWYFEFFDGNPFYFAESHFFNEFIESPYDMPVGFLLTKIYWGEPTVFANNGIVSDGFMNLGYLGVVLFSIIFTSLFALFNSFKMHKGYFGLFFCYIYIMLSAPLLTCFITGGIALFMFLWFFILNNKMLKH